MEIKALTLWADGLEEMEAVTPVDLLRRAGVQVTVAGIKKRTVLGARGISLNTDCLLSEVEGDYDALILPGGGPGAKNLSESQAVLETIKDFDQKKKIIAAICAAPAVVLNKTGLLSGKKATCYPGMETLFDEDIIFVAQNVVTDGHLLTSRGPGTAVPFSLQLIEWLVSKEMKEEISNAALLTLP